SCEARCWSPWLFSSGGSELLGHPALVERVGGSERQGDVGIGGGGMVERRHQLQRAAGVGAGDGERPGTDQGVMEAAHLRLEARGHVLPVLEELFDLLSG